MSVISIMRRSRDVSKQILPAGGEGLTGAGELNRKVRRRGGTSASHRLGAGGGNGCGAGPYPADRGRRRIAALVRRPGAGDGPVPDRLQCCPRHLVPPLAEAPVGG